MKRILPLILCLLLVLPCLLVPAFASGFLDEYQIYTDPVPDESIAFNERGEYYRWYRNLPVGQYTLLFFSSEDVCFYLIDECVDIQYELQDLGGSYGWSADFMADSGEWFELRYDSAIDNAVHMYAPTRYIETTGAFYFIPYVEEPEATEPTAPPETEPPTEPPTEPTPGDPDSPSTSPLSSVKESMTSVISWLGAIATALLSGELSPLLLLLVIPIAISIIFVAIKAIKYVFNL